jgi:hypothetical protein
VPRRLRQNAIDRCPAVTSSVSSVAVSRCAEPRQPSISSNAAGFHSATMR